MKEDITAAPCVTCECLKKTIDKRNWVHYTCKHAPNKEWLGGPCRDSLNPCCGYYKRKSVNFILTKH